LEQPGQARGRHGGAQIHPTQEQLLFEQANDITGNEGEKTQEAHSQTGQTNERLFSPGTRAPVCRRPQSWSQQGMEIGAVLTEQNPKDVVASMIRLCKEYPSMCPRCALVVLENFRSQKARTQDWRVLVTRARHV
jgi:hypothetical protein